jgi:hypothetical protein
VFTVHVHVVPAPRPCADDVAAAYAARADREIVRVTPVTGSLNVSVYGTVSAIVGLVHARTRDSTSAPCRSRDGKRSRHVAAALYVASPA